MKRRAAEPSTEAEGNVEETAPKGDESEAKKTAGNEPWKRTERGKEVGSRGRELEETKAGAEGGSKEGNLRRRGGTESGAAEWKPL